MDRLAKTTMARNDCTKINKCIGCDIGTNDWFERHGQVGSTCNYMDK